MALTRQAARARRQRFDASQWVSLIASRAPSVVRHTLRKCHREFVFWRALRALERDPEAVAREPVLVLADLVYGWGNAGWSGEEDYLRACLRHALSTPGPVLECGSGLTTLLLGVVAQKRGFKVWTLEHIPDWRQRVQRYLQRYGIRSVQVCNAPLRSFGDFDWYDPSAADFPPVFALVVCDGPPSTTRGGRYGLMAMKNQLRPGSVILLDDAERTAEQYTAGRWCTELQCASEKRGSDEPYFELTLLPRTT